MRGLSRWRQVVPIAVVVLVAGSVAAAAFTSTGYHQRQVTLDDGSVWTAQAVSSDPANPGSYVGRANLAADVIDTAIAAPAYPQLLQDGPHVVFHDAGSGTVTSINTILGTTGKPLTVPAITAPAGTLAVGAAATEDTASNPRVDLNAAGEVGMGADTVAVVDQGAGKLYLFPADALPGGALSAQQPAAAVAKDSKVVVGLDGVTHVVAPDGTVDDYSTTGRRVRHSTLGVDLTKVSTPGSPWTVSAIGGLAVVLDGSGGVYVEGHKGQLAAASGDAAVLQEPGPARSSVLLETSSSLLSVTLGSGSVSVLASTGSGPPTAPVYVPERGCAYAAWDGSAAVAADASSSGSPARAPTVAVRCPGRAGYDGPGEANPIWRINAGNALLNDEVSGANVFFDDLVPRMVADWTQANRPGKGSAAVTPSAVTVSTANSPSLPSTVEHPPIANPDVAATRPGLPVIVPVLRNDTDPDGDLLAVSAVTQPPNGLGSVAIVDGGGAVQVTPSGDGLTPITFGYTADDGRSGTSRSTVTVNIHPDGVNTPPDVPPATAPVTVAAGGRITLDLLQNVTDADGDAVTLTSASLPPGDGSVSITSAGLAIVSPARAGAITLSFAVTDGHGDSVPGSQPLLVKPAGSEVPPQAHDDRLQVRVGETSVVDVLANDIDAGPTPLSVTSVTAPPGLTVSQPSDGITGDAGVLSVRATAPGTSLVRYVASDGQATSPATLRVDAVAGPSAGTPPVTAVRDDAVVRTGIPTVIPVLANDLDQAGNVLVVDGISGVPTGLTVTQTDHATLTVRAAQPLSAPASFTYTASDGVNSAIGTVVVSPAPSGGIDAPPVTSPVTATVRAGNAIALDVLAADFDPEGESLTLSAVDPLPAGEGTVFIEANQLRYVAPATAVGAVSIDYTATDSAGNASSGTAVVHVVPLNAPNHPPQPPTVISRVFTGSSVTVPLPLAGIDPDGDVTTLVSVAPAGAGGTGAGGTGAGGTGADGTGADGAGADGTGADGTGGALGTVGAPLGLDRFTFTAGSVGGTQSLNYQVRDSGGLLATGSIRIGVVDPPLTDTPPVALPDTISVAPGATRQVAVLDNDSDADGDPLHLDPAALTPPSAGTATTSGDLIVVTAPADARENTSISLGYGITDGRGETATSTLTETITSHPAPALPTAVDDLTAPQRAGNEVSVPVLANDVIVNGTTAQARVAAIPNGGTGPAGGTAGASAAGGSAGATPSQASAAAPTPTVTAGPGGTLRFVMPDAPTSFGYTVTDAAGLTSSAVVRVPLATGQPPVANPDTATTPAGSPVTVDLTANDSDPQGLPLRVTAVDAGAGGVPTLVSASSARFTPAAGFSGLASFGYTLTDGASTTSGLVTVTVVEPNRPPTVKTLTTRVSAGRSTTLDLRAGASDPDIGDTLSFGAATVSGGPTTGVTARLAGSSLTVSATPSAPSGSLTIRYSVRDSHGAATPGTVAVTVVGRKPASKSASSPSASPSPTAALPQAVPDTASTLAGQTVSVPVLANDVDPLGRGLHLVSASGAGGRVTTTTSTVVFTPSPSFHGVASLSYLMADASGDPTRQATGSLRVTVVGRPDAPGVPSGVPGNGQVTLRWATPDANGGHISGYTVHFGVSVRSCRSTTCVITGLPNGHAYTFTVTATDQAGTGPASGVSASYVVDVAPSAPGAPVATAGNRAASLTWTAPASPGSAITGYTVLVSPGGTTVTTTTPTATVSGLTNGTAYTFTVTATNRAGTSPPSAPSAAVTPASSPATPATPRATVASDGSTVTATWAAPDAMGSPITSYTLREYVDSKYSTSYAITDASVLKRTVTASLGHLYAFTVAATNALGTSAYSAESTAVKAAAKPAQVGTVKATAGDTKATLTWTAPAANGDAITKYVVTLSTGATRTLTTAGGTITGLTNGKSYTFRVAACNSVGCGPASAASNAVTPAAAAKPKSHS